MEALKKRLYRLGRYLLHRRDELERVIARESRQYLSEMDGKISKGGGLECEVYEELESGPIRH